MRIHKAVENATLKKNNRFLKDFSYNLCFSKKCVYLAIITKRLIPSYHEAFFTL